MRVWRECIVPAHAKVPQLNCGDCQERFCADCAAELATRNSIQGADVCNRCLDIQEAGDRND